MPDSRRRDAPAPAATTRGTGLIAGLALLIILLLLPAPDGMPAAAWRTAAVAALMATWWVTEAIPIPATALLPLVLFPVLGILTIGESAAPYGNPIIYLFLGGFLLALALERCGLHRRIALAIIGVVGARPGNLVGGFMAATALLSMWVSNTATVVMMLPIAVSIIALVHEEAVRAGTSDRNVAVALLLGIAYAASIGGVGTLIGTPPNALLAAFMLEVYQVRIGFAQWMMFGLPLVLVALPLTGVLLTRIVFPVPRVELAGGAAMIARERGSLGPMTAGERRVGFVVALVALAWTTQPLLARVLPGLSDTTIAIAGALLLFMMPLGRGGELALNWKQAERLPWGVLVLFGGGLSLAAAIQSTGLAGWIGTELSGLRALPLVVVTLMVTAVIVFLTELTSNTATAAAFLPVVASTAVALGADPLLLAIPTAVGASCAFMLPVATPPNALVYASGEVTIGQMMRAGLWLNVLLIVLLNVAVFVLGGLVFPGMGR